MVSRCRAALVVAKILAAIRLGARASFAVPPLKNNGGQQHLRSLTPGVVYNIQANVVGAAGPSDWSDPVPQMVV